jgi:hypothetical protein
MASDEALANSFANVKKDIMKLQANILEISTQQAELFRMLTQLKNSLGKEDKSTSSKSKVKK